MAKKPIKKIKGIDILLGLTPAGRLAKVGKKALPFLVKGVRKTAGFIVKKPRTALGIALGAPAFAGFVTTKLGRKIFSPFQRFKGGKRFGEDPSGTIGGFFGFGKGTKNGASDLISRQMEQARERGRGITNIFGGTVPKIVIGAGLGAGLTALAGALLLRAREGSQGLAPDVFQSATLGAVPEPTLEEPIPQPSGLLGIPRITVKPNIHVSVKPKILNIQQTSVSA